VFLNAFSVEIYSEPGPLPRGAYWERFADIEEVPVEGYTPYSEIGSILRTIEKESERVKVDIVGKSAGGRDIYLVTISDPSTLGRLSYYKSIAKTIVEDPDKALAMLDRGELDYKVPVYMHGNIHGSEQGGTDACLNLIRDLAYRDSDDIRKILNNLIVLIVPTMNPDGRIADRGSNDNLFNLNREFITASQPETRTIISIMRDWNPVVAYDLHGYYPTYTMDPCTPPYNPAHPVDLYLKWLIPMALSMKEKLVEAGFGVTLPYFDWGWGWDAYVPIYAETYPYYHGSFGWMAEACPSPRVPASDILSHYTAIKTGITFVAKNKEGMFRDQIEMFRRWCNRMGGKFPYAYIIPMGQELQIDPLQAAKFVDHMIFHGVKVHQANNEFFAGGIKFPAGTYVVLMSQGKSGLASVLLSEGEDLSYDPGLPMYDISAWNFPELWGFTRFTIDEEFEAYLSPVSNAFYPVGGVIHDLIALSSSNDFAYAIRCTTNNAFRTINRLLDLGYVVHKTKEPFDYNGISFEVGTFLIPTGQPEIIPNLNTLAKEFHISVYCIDADPNVEYTTIKEPKVAILYDTGVSAGTYGETRFVLNSLEFKFDTIDAAEIKAGHLVEYDVVYVPDGSYKTIWTKLGTKGQEKLMEFIEGGGNYIGVGRGGAALVNEAQFIGASANVIYSRVGGYINGICSVQYAPDLITSGYPQNSYAFVWYPVLFSVGKGVNVIANLAEENMFMAGFWPGWEKAQGKAIVVQGQCGEGNVILYGTQPLFRAHTELTYRLVANSLYCD